MNTILLQTDSAGSSAIFVVGLIFIFILLIAVGLKGGKGYKQLKASYEGKITEEFNFKYCQGFFTEDELIINMKSRKVSSIYKLSDIKSAAIAWDPSARTWNLIVRGDNDKLLKGESSDGKNRKAKRLGEQHTIEKQSKDALWDLLMKHAPHVTKADI